MLPVHASRYLFWSQHVRVWIAKESQCWHSTILGARPTTDLQRSKSYGWPPPCALCSIQPLDAQNHLGRRQKLLKIIAFILRNASIRHRMFELHNNHKANFLLELRIANEEKRLWHFGTVAALSVATLSVAARGKTICLTWRPHPTYTWVARWQKFTKILP